MSCDKITQQIDNEFRPVFTIGIAAEMVGVSVHTLRLYESSGLIIPQRTQSLRRLYSRNDIRRLNSIRYLIEEKGLNIAGIKALLSMIPCWEIKKCTTNDRKNCDAFNKISDPCWIVKNKGNVCEANECRTCQVYTDFSAFSEIKKHIFKSLNLSRNK